MGIETIGVLVNIAGDAGGLVSAVNKATDAFKAFQTNTVAATKESTPAWNRLALEIKGVEGRMALATRVQETHKKSAAELSKTMEKLKADMALPLQGVDQATQKAYLSGLTEEYRKQEAQLKKVTTYISDYDIKLGILASRKDRLKLDQDQVRVEQTQTKWQKLFAVLGAGAEVYNRVGETLGKVGKLFGGTGKPAFGAEDSMLYDKTAGSIRQMSDAASRSGPSFGLMAAAMAAGQIAANALITFLSNLVNSIGQTATALINLGQQATLAAARNQELGIVAQYMGQQAGHSAAEIDAITASLKKAGASTKAANDTITQFSRSNMDLTKATDLLAVSQGAAIIAGQDSSAVMQQLIYGIVTLQPEMLRTSGIIINADQAYKDYAATLKVNVNSLTGQQKQQAFLNATLVEGAKLQGLYAEAMKLPGKQMRTLTDREIPELIAILGVPFQSVFTVGVESARSFVKWLSEAFTKGGALYPILESLGAGFFKIASTIQEIVKIGSSAFAPMLDGWSGKIKSLIDNASTWGSNLIIQFANGILDGVGAVIDALSYVGSIITYWLTPGSPPKLLPDLTKWGAGAIAAYMEGWDSADFSAFNSISGKLESFIKSIDDEIVGKNNVIPMIRAMREAVAQAIEQVDNFGKIAPNAADNIAKKFGGLGSAVRAYVQAALEAAVADEKVSKAQKNLNDITTAYDDKLKVLNDKLNSYNQDNAAAEEDKKLKALQRVLTRVSSTDAEKEAAQKEINYILLQRQIRLTENEKKTAVDAATTKLTAAQKEQELAHQKLEYQQQLLDMQQKENELMKEAIALMNQAKDAAAKTGGAGGAGTPDKAKPGPLGVPKLELPEKFKFEVPEGILKLADKLKEIQDKWNALWGDGGTLSTAKKNLEEFGKKLLEFKDNFLTKAEEAIAGLKSEFGRLGDMVPKITIRIPIDWRKMLNDIATMTSNFLLDTPTRIYNWLSFTMAMFRTVLSIVRGDWKGAWIELEDAVTHFLATFGIKMDDVKRIIRTTVDGVKSKFIEMGTQIHKIVEMLGSVVNYLQKDFIGAMTLAKDFIVNFFLALALKPLKDMIDGIYNGILAAAQAFKDLQRVMTGGGKQEPKGRAEGGPVLAGHTYPVGERGPELFTPNINGFIVPNNVIKGLMPSNYITNSGGNSNVQYVKNNTLNVTSTVSSQGLAADWARLQLLGA